MLINGKNLLEEIGAAHFRLFVFSDGEVAWDADLFALLLQEASESGVVDAIALDDRDGGGLSVPDPYGRVVLGDVSEGEHSRESFLYLSQSFMSCSWLDRAKGFPDHGMADASQADLLLQQERIEGRLPAHGHRCAQTRDDWRSTGSSLLGSAMSSW